MAKVITFSRVFPSHHPRKGEPTLFVESIEPILMDIFDLPTRLAMYEMTDPLIGLGGGFEFFKYHTIRQNHPVKGPRFKVGDKFSPRVWSGIPYNSKMVTFAPDVTVAQTYHFEITINGRYLLDGDELNYDQIATIAHNDALSYGDFISWFNTRPFDGQVICWRDPEYLKCLKLKP
jgi:hypothetical protein